MASGDQPLTTAAIAHKVNKNVACILATGIFVNGDLLIQKHKAEEHLP